MSRHSPVVMRNVMGSGAANQSMFVDGVPVGWRKVDNKFKIVPIVGGNIFDDIGSVLSNPIVRTVGKAALMGLGIPKESSSPAASKSMILAGIQRSLNSSKAGRRKQAL